MKNEIIDEVREARAALAAEHGYDRQRIYEWARATHAARQQANRNPDPWPNPVAAPKAAEKSSDAEASDASRCTPVGID